MPSQGSKKHSSGKGSGGGGGKISAAGGGGKSSGGGDDKISTGSKNSNGVSSSCVNNSGVNISGVDSPASGSTDLGTNSGVSGNTCEVCGKPAKQFCSSCRCVYYCTRDCQKKAWKDHKIKCKPFTVQVHPVYGRHLVASRDIKAGETLLRETPILVGPKQKSPALCLGCHRPAGNTSCTRCGYTVCGPQCQDTKYHKDECRILSRAPTPVHVHDTTLDHHLAFSCIMILRCLLCRTHDYKTWDVINTMQDHLADVKGGDLYTFFMTNVVGFLRDYLKYDDADEETILKMCGILTTNSFEVKHNGSRVRGLYNIASKMAHSCVPNTKHVCEGDLTLEFIATVKIPKGTSITTNYTQILWNTMARRQHLKMVKFFLCECPRCTDPTELGTHYSTLLCEHCGGATHSTQPLNFDGEWACSKCDHTMPAKQVRWGDAVLFRELRDLDKKTPERLERFLKVYREALHPQNRFFVEAKYALVKLYGNSTGCRYRDMTREQLENKVAWCRELLELGSVIDPGLSLFRGSVLFELQAGIVAMAKHLLSNDIITSDGAKEYMKEAAEVLQEATVILNHEPEMRDGGLGDRLAKLSEELEL